MEWIIRGRGGHGLERPVLQKEEVAARNGKENKDKSKEGGERGQEEKESGGREQREKKEKRAST